MHRFTKTHLVGQYAAHAQAVQGIQPMETPFLIGVQAADGALGLLILWRSQAGRLGGDIHRQAGVFDQCFQVGCPVSLEVSQLALILHRLQGSLGKLLPGLGILQGDKRAVFIAEVFLFAADGLQHAHQLLNGRAVVQYGQLQLARGPA
ncbi:hypothetical protein SDC9_162021 [bioreactor metagenome]|uniref:Uncharacterized protein n=1 Tax=bioreactor metagenome TaxID=1076179 RepID=A0A645FR71_9ZZZZ